MGNAAGLSIEHLSVSGMPPTEHIRLAAGFGCRYVSLVLRSPGNGPDRFPPWSLIDSARLRHDVVAALADHGVSVSLGDGFVVYAGQGVDSHLPALDVHAELGTARISTVSFDPDLARAADQIAQLAEEAAQRGMETVIEPVPALPINSLALALDIVRQAGNPGLRLLIDTMHMARSGVTGESLRAVPAAHVGYVQLCDAPLRSELDYLTESVTERRPPGEGELPLAQLVDALPPGLIVGLEVPMHTEARSGVPVSDRVARCLAGARRLLA